MGQHSGLSKCDEQLCIWKGIYFVKQTIVEKNKITTGHDGAIEILKASHKDGSQEASPSVIPLTY